MANPIALEKGGRNAAFFLFLFSIAVLGFGSSLQYPLAVLRAGAFGAALVHLWSRRGDAVPVGPYPLLVGSFLLLAFGHAFSSVYSWVSIQHAVNVALAAVLLAWAVLLFRADTGKLWNATCLVAAAFALVEIGIALFQRFPGADLRPRGTFDNANYLAEFLAAASLLWIAQILWRRGARTLRVAAAAMSVLFLAAAFSLSRSRGVLLATVPALGLLLVSRWGLRKGGALFAAAGIPGLTLLGFGVAARFFGLDIYNYSRWIIWKSALRTFLEHPLGVGLGGFKYYWFATQSPVADAFRRYGKFADTAHNEYLEVLSGLGVVGFLLFLAILAYPLFLAVRFRKEIPPDRRPIAAGAAGVLVLSGAHALVNSNFHVFGIFFLDAAMLGALVSCLPGRPTPAVTLPSWGNWLGMVACAGLLVVAVATGIGAFLFDRGERLLRSGELSGAERSFSAAMYVDPFRSSYPDALSAVRYRRYLAERPSMDKAWTVPESMFDTLRWEDRARELSPRDPKYMLRLSRLFFELYRLRREPSDALMALRLADGSLRNNPYGVEILWHKADVLSFLGKQDEALRELEAAVSIEPNFCRGYARLAELARDADTVRASLWLQTAEECRGRAAGRHLEENEKWLVEPTEDR